MKLAFVVALSVTLFFWKIALAVGPADCDRDFEQMASATASVAPKIPVTPNLGKPVDVSKLPFSVPEGSKVTRLGGQNFGTVYRIQHLSGTSEIVKYYDEASSAKEDFELMQLLYKVSQKPGYQGLRVQKPIALEGNLMRSEDAIGETVLAVRKDLKDDPEKKGDALWLRFRTALDATYAALKEEIPNLQVGSGGGVRSAHWDDPLNSAISHRVYPHATNVILTANSNDLVIIDPR